MTNETFVKFIDKLIDDTKAKKIKWNKSNELDTSNFAEYWAYIENTGKIYISRGQEERDYLQPFSFPKNTLELSIEPSDNKLKSESITMTSSSNDNYGSVLRLYNLVNHIYNNDAPINSSLERTITAYINRPN